MILIKKFDEQYNKFINDFIISIYVDEFGYEQSREELKNQDNRIYPQNGGNLWIAFNENGEIVGTIAIAKQGQNDAELKKFYVRHDYRGKGISKELYNTALEFCKTNCFKRVYLWTYDKLDKAINFYLKAGFIELENMRKKSGACCFELQL